MAKAAGARSNASGENANSGGDTAATTTGRRGGARTLASGGNQNWDQMEQELRENRAESFGKELSIIRKYQMQSLGTSARTVASGGEATGTGRGRGRRSAA